MIYIQLNVCLYMYTGGVCCQGTSAAGSNVPTLADLLAVNVFELDDWNYEGEDEDTVVVVNKTDITEVSITPVGQEFLTLE